MNFFFFDLKVIIAFVLSPFYLKIELADNHSKSETNFVREPKELLFGELHNCCIYSWNSIMHVGRVLKVVDIPQHFFFYTNSDTVEKGFKTILFPILKLD